MNFSAINATALMLIGSVASAAPSVNGNTISWPDDGWYQVQLVTNFGNIEACQGGRSCDVSPGEYNVINHSSGERFNGIVVGVDNTTASPIAVTGSTISWPDDGWYQVLAESNYSEACAGGRSCMVAPGSYAVINHSTGVRVDGIVVGEDITTVSPIVINGNTINWPDDGWYQVLDQSTYSEVCGGTRSCPVVQGLYTVINHSTGMRWKDINVGEPSTSFTRVNFDITVPAYQSTELLVKLNWHDIDISASWNSDELWTAIENFPTDTERLLTVTFHDMNGGIKLGSVEQAFNTGSNASQSVQITADQFDTSWDNDNDGISNLAELKAGTDPLIAETMDLRITNNYTVGMHDWVLRSFESRASNERPYSVQRETTEGSFSVPNETSTTLIDIDNSGTGSVFHQSQYSNSTTTHFEKDEATRTNTGYSVIWAGSDFVRHTGFNSYTQDFRFNVETTKIDEQTVRQVAVTEYETLDYLVTSSFDFVGKKISTHPFAKCLPVTGTHVSTSNEGTRTSTVTKNPGDEYWHVVTRKNGNIVDEYLAQWVDAQFTCALNDLD